MKIAVFNFKAEFNLQQAKQWVLDFKSFFAQASLSPDVRLIFCPPAVFLPLFQKELGVLPIYLGSQDLSQFEKGAYTGEVTGEMLKSLVNYVIVGHQERRQYFHENQSILAQKILQAKKHNLRTILCSQKVEDYQISPWALAFEPVSAIGTGKPSDPSVSWQKAEPIKKAVKAKYCLYGGSVNSKNITSFIQAGFDGVLIGKKSLEPTQVMAIVQKL